MTSKTLENNKAREACTQRDQYLCIFFLIIIIAIFIRENMEIIDRHFKKDIIC